MSVKHSKKQNKSEEIWYDIPGWEGLYQLSNKDRVKSLPRKCKVRNGGIRMSEERILVLVKDENSRYLKFNLCRDGWQKSMCLHQVKLMVFVGLCPEGMEACHNDGDATNNNINNLRWDTHTSNLNDRVDHGTSLRGYVGLSYKLTKDDVAEIFRLWDGNLLSRPQLAKKFNVSLSAIHYHLKKREI